MHQRNNTGAFAPHARLARRFFWASVTLALATVAYTGSLPDKTASVLRETARVEEARTEDEPPSYKAVYAYVTGYNTVEAQTDATPCLSASGDDICGRSDVVACPRHLPLGTVVEIDGKTYTCLDRTNAKYNDRFDISCDKDFSCPAQVTGWKEVRVYE